MWSNSKGKSEIILERKLKSNTIKKFEIITPKPKVQPNSKKKSEFGFKNHNWKPVWETRVKSKSRRICETKSQKKKRVIQIWNPIRRVKLKSNWKAKVKFNSKIKIQFEKQSWYPIQKAITRSILGVITKPLIIPLKYRFN